MRCISVAVLALVAPYVSGELSVDTLVLLLRFSSTWCMSFCATVAPRTRGSICGSVNVLSAFQLS
jgi:hypothetical protein